MPGSPTGLAWDSGRPFGADLDGGREQRQVVDRALEANGADAAKIDLHVLNLSGLTLTAEEIQTIGTMKQLRELNLRKTNVQDRDVLFLANLSRLESFELSETAVSDAALPSIRALKKIFAHSN